MTVQASSETPDRASDLRAHLHGMWASVAPAWSAHAEYADARAAALTTRLLELARPRRGEQVLELACGAGGTGLAAAERVAPGETVLSDVVPEMTTIAAARAAARGLDNVTTRVLDLDSIEQEDASFDVVLCREGLMFALDPARATTEIARILRPRGRAALAVWGPRAQNPWLGIVLDTVAAQLGRPVPPPTVPGPFALADAGTLEQILRAAGLDDVTVEEFAVPLRVNSLDDWWMRVSALAGPLANILAAMAPEARDALRTRAEDAAAGYATSDGYEFPGLALVAGATRRSAV